MLELNSINQGDCLEIMKQIDDKSIDLICCDLPYGITACKWDVPIDLKALWEQYERIIKDTGIIVLFASFKFASSLYESNKKLFRYDLVWSKPLGSGFLNANKMPLRNHEFILVFYKKTGAYNPIMKIGRYREKAGGKNSECYSGFKIDKKKNDTYFPSSIIEISNGDKARIATRHPTQKPVALLEYLIKTYSNEGDVVLDNCAGSGTTAVACLNLGRKYIMIEREEKYCKIIKERVSGRLF